MRRSHSYLRCHPGPSRFINKRRSRRGPGDTTVSGWGRLLVSNDVHLMGASGVTSSERLNGHNATVDAAMVKQGLCGTIHLATGRRCRRPARHTGGCLFTGASAAPAPPGLSLDVRVDIDRPDVTAIVHGTVEAANADEFHRRIGELLGVGAGRVTLDLSRADLSPTGRAAVADLRRIAAANAVELRVVTIGSADP